MDNKILESGCKRQIGGLLFCWTLFMLKKCFGMCSAEVCQCSETAKDCRTLHCKSVRV